MFNLFSSCKARLRLISAIFAFSFLLLGVYFYNSILKVEELSELQSNIVKIDSYEKSLSNDVKNFLARKKLKYFDSYQKKLQEVGIVIVKASETSKIYNIDQSALENVMFLLSQNYATFTEAVSIQEQIGLNKHKGAYASLEKNVHLVEDMVKKESPEQLLTLLMLRRHEKDFMLR